MLLTRGQLAELETVVRATLPRATLRVRVAPDDNGPIHLFELSAPKLSEEEQLAVSDALVDYCFARAWPCSWVVLEADEWAQPPKPMRRPARTRRSAAKSR
jgi:hypothetical protein